jgi:hypothetical protein
VFDEEEYEIEGTKENYLDLFPSLDLRDWQVPSSGKKIRIQDF